MIQRIEMTIDCQDLATMSQFWTRLLGYDHPEPMDGRYWAATHPRVVGPRLVFQLMDDSQPRSKSALHIDLHVDDIHDTVEQVEQLGGSRIDVQPISEAGSTWVRCLDPEGNVFCVVLSRD